MIAMLAIGKRAKQEIMEQMKMVGVNNIIINPILRKNPLRRGGRSRPINFRGLSILDVEAQRGIAIDKDQPGNLH